jgi:predicted nucleotidyltransferase
MLKEDSKNVTLNRIGYVYFHMEEKPAILFKVLNLYRSNYEASLHARAIGKLLNASHMTLLPHLKRLAELKILNSTTVGRNKQYTLNRQNSLTKYYLTTTEQLVTLKFLEESFLMRKFAEHLNSIDIVNPLILFGSYAKGYANEESDIDLFCIGEISESQLAHIKTFENTYGKQTNVKTVSTENFYDGLHTGDILIKEVIKDHIILCNPDPFVTMLWRNHIER